MTNCHATVMVTMDRLTPNDSGSIRSDATGSGLLDRATERGAKGSGSHSTASLGELFVSMRTSNETERDAAWEECYKRCWQMVWTRVFYVMRTISWAGEPRELAADVASDVFLGLPDAVQHYREEGKPEQWLKQVAIRTALRKKESLTGRWSSGRSGGEAVAPDDKSKGRSFVSYDESADQIVARLDAVEREELMELDRRREALRNSDDATRRRWDEFLQLYIDGFDFSEIGTRMGITEASARNWLCKIRKYLAQPLDARSQQGN
jgi:RNA polymerase sigma factor (sigma-70 family)